MNWLIHPIKSVSGWGVRKFVLSKVNSALDRYQVNVDRTLAIVDYYIAKVSAMMRFLNSFRDKVLDHKITNEEADALLEEAGTLAKELTA